MAYGDINKRLRRDFGENLFHQPLWRLVLSIEQYEWRKGTFDVCYGAIFLRTEVGVKEVPKYNYLPECWILERLFPGEITHHPDLPHSGKGSYEPIYVFLRGSEQLPVREDVIRIVINTWNNRVVAGPAERKSRDEEAQAREIREIEDSLDTVSNKPWSIADSKKVKEQIKLLGETQ